MASASSPPILTRLDLPTPYATLTVTTSIPSVPNPSPRSAPKPDILLIHGNSSSSQIWRSFFFPPHTLPTTSTSTSTLSQPQSKLPISQTHRLIAVDLPGHGTSTPLPAHIKYSMPLYAHTILSLLNSFQIESLIILGWSLGGHIGIELIPLLQNRLKGLMLVGTPPIPRGQVELGFYMEGGHMGAAESEILNVEEVTAFAKAVAGVEYGGKYEGWQREDVARTDGRSRSEMWDAFRNGEGVDQKVAVEESKDVLIGVVNGERERFVRLDYLDEIRWGKLWRGKCERMEGLGHAPFWEAWERFEEIFGEFVADCNRLADESTT